MSTVYVAAAVLLPSSWIGDDVAVVVVVVVELGRGGDAEFAAGSGDLVATAATIVFYLVNLGLFGVAGVGAPRSEQRKGIKSVGTRIDVISAV